ncbi:uncharacterized protein LOC143288468 [Babylonia areolata]|uniref:uncharacterized protein LOC143288468 n=1 Tax=Babylonia areolata TaxID=304850 RepID=UPI003FD28898
MTSGSKKKKKKHMMAQNNGNGVDDRNSSPKLSREQAHKERLSKRLSYILRYAARKEGLQVDDSGFVDLHELLLVPMLSQYCAEEVMAEIKDSQSRRGSHRFECRIENGKVLVRASYGRRMEKNPHHDDSQVFTLFESSVQVILNNLGQYDLENFPDDYLIGFMLNRLARQKKLNNASLKVLLVPALEHLNLEDVYLTQNTLRIVYAQCPHLKSLSLRNCSYIVTDSLLNQLTKKLVDLEFLNLTGCHHLTDKCIKCLVTNLPCLTTVGFSLNKGITEAGIIHLLSEAPALRKLDVYGLRTSEEAKQIIDQIRSERKIVVIMSGLEEKDENGVIKRIAPTYQKGMM